LLFSETLNDNLFDRLTTVLAYVAPVLGGLRYSCAPTRSQRWAIVLQSVLPAVLVAVTQTVKGLLFFCIALFFAGVLVHRISTGRLYVLDRATLRSTGLGVLLVLPVVTASFVFRGLSDVDDSGVLLSRLGTYYASYVCGHAYAFADWFAFVVGDRSVLTYATEPAAYGFYTFMAVFQLLGSTRYVPAGVFEDYYSYGDQLTSNLFTMYRGLILDFGFTGAILVMFAAGVLLHWAFRGLLQSRVPVFTAAVFVFMVGFFYNSYIISLLIWNRVYLAFVLLWLVLAVNRRLHRPGSVLEPSSGPVGEAEAGLDCAQLGASGSPAPS
jgi:oligosaccharide repeat unit polymerase